MLCTSQGGGGCRVSASALSLACLWFPHSEHQPGVKYILPEPQDTERLPRGTKGGNILCGIKRALRSVWCREHYSRCGHEFLPVVLLCCGNINTKFKNQYFKTLTSNNNNKSSLHLMLYFVFLGLYC